MQRENEVVNFIENQKNKGKAGAEMKTKKKSAEITATDEIRNEMAVAENECRFGVSPLADAKLIRSMVDLGRSQSEIAALVGVSEATVCRRAKLFDLVPEIVDVVDGIGVDAKALEMIAAYPADVQKKAAKKIGERISYCGQIKPKVVDSIFGDLTRKISRSLWIFEGAQGEARYRCCLACAACTGNQRDLFGVDETHGRNDDIGGMGEKRYLGNCQNVKCFRRLETEAKREAIAAAIERTSKGVGADGIVTCGSARRKPFCELKSKKRVGENTFAYVHWDSCENMPEILWGPDPDKKKKAAAGDQETHIGQGVRGV